MRLWSSAGTFSCTSLLVVLSYLIFLETIVSWLMTVYITPGKEPPIRRHFSADIRRHLSDKTPALSEKYCPRVLETIDSYLYVNFGDCVNARAKG